MKKALQEAQPVKAVRSSSLILSTLVKSTNWRDVLMIEVQMSSSADSVVQEGRKIRSSELLSNNISICLAVRRPGCSFCREQALSLTTLTRLYPDCFRQIQIFGVIKETNVEGLVEFQRDFFPFPPI